jgi:glycogen operon protein
MLLAGDEILRSQRGNNNAYCQDNALSWMNWHFDADALVMLRFVREMIALRKRHASLRRRRFLTGATEHGRTHRDVAWHGERLECPTWGDPSARLVAYTLAGLAPGEPMLHVILNMNDDARDVELPTLDDATWRRIVDTAAQPPSDIVGTIESAHIECGNCRVEPRSVVVLESR